MSDARELLTALEKEPSSKAARDELRRRVHALGAGARLLRFEAMTQSLQEALAVLDRGAQAGALDERQLGFVAQVLDDLPTLAWSEVTVHEPPPPIADGSSEPASAGTPIAVLVVGGEELAAALVDAGRTRAFECERTDDTESALELARTFGPDVLLIDADLPRGSELVEALLDDPLTDPVPVVVVGTFSRPEELSRYIALGAAKTLTKPVEPELLRASCDQIVDARDGPTVRVTLGEPTLEQLADRLAEELRRALVDSIDRPARSHRVPLGEGSEVLGALWGAIARVQEIVTEKTGGAIRFGGEAPEGAIALAPNLHHDVAATDRAPARGRGAAADVRLNGRRVVVADDDPGVTWFVSDLLRTAGCEVHEALDGTTALELAFRVHPELVVSDILMPGIDGFALCRALRRDVALRETPVILLSWKEDLLQRVRELGASAAAYMRKETGSRAILARVREVLRPRARVEARLRSDGEVRGRLDGLAPRVLLELVCRLRPDARVSVRDATYLYEIEVRGGTLRRATRTASDGSHRSGERALASLLGVGAGRFVVTSTTEPLHGELTGTLFEQLARPIAMARAALAATTGPRTMSVERIVFDEEALADYLRATPEPTRTLIVRLTQGATPKRLLLGGEAAPGLIEDILADLAARGTIRAVEGAGRADLLHPAFDAAWAVLMSAGELHRAPPASARPSAPAPGARTVSVGPIRGHPAAAAPPAGGRTAEYETLVVSEPPPAAAQEEDDAAPSSLEDAVMREISERLSEPRGSTPTSDPPPIIKPSELLVRRAADPNMGDDAPFDALAASPSLASIPPDAVVPAASPGEHPSNAAPAQSPVRSPIAAPAESSPDAVIDKGIEPAFDPENTVPAVRATIPAPEPPANVPTSPRSRWGVLLALGALASAAAALLRWTTVEPRIPAHAQSDGGASIPIAFATPPAEAHSSIEAPAARSGPAKTWGEDLPSGAAVPPGFGLLDVTAPGGAPIRIDGKVAGAGPVVSTAAAPGYHEVSVLQGGRESTQVIEVRAGKTTRVRSSSVP